MKNTADSGISAGSGRGLTRIAVRRGHCLRGYAYRFLEECAPTLTQAVVKGALDAE
ncbi:hypothetical protein [Rhizobacter sp. Root404]|uniref:hypothetical protein n=1 Tax=Rhizobacter sp. Root404 TaxID=1736528 RepID=UPI000A857607|nr:hypothetical protein [Rhizobacter sp. Root404]